ncbi:MAG: GAF domain-containing protein [Deltaproteobacteria bacterium]|nr:GAF domain-containing protein [Deltaproteobacteria bacterium]
MSQPPRRTLPAVPYRTWIFAGLAALIVVVCTINSLSWINRPFPGFFLWGNLFVPTLGDTDWTGYEAGIPVAARLVAVNGKPATSAEEVYRLAEAVPLGTAISYTFASETAAPPLVLLVRTMRLTLPEYLWTLGNYLALGMLLLLPGLVVYILRPDAPAARAMFSAGATWGLYFVTAADIVGPAWFRPLCLLLQAINPVALLHLGLTFPVERGVVRRHAWLIPVLYALGCAIGAVANVIFPRSFVGILYFNRLHALAVAGALLILTGSLVHGFFTLPMAAKQRIKIAAVGGCTAFLLPGIGVALFSVVGASFPLNLLALPVVLFPFAISYAIVKHDLFEADAIVRRTVAWAILTVLIATIYLGGLGLLDIIASPHRGRIGQLAFLLVIVAVFPRLRERVQAGVDFLFARDRYDYGQTVGNASRALATLLDTDAVVDRILQTITGAMHVDFGAVWLRDGSRYRLHTLAGNRGTPPTELNGSSAMVAALEADPERIITGDSEHPLKDDLERCGSALVIPMAFESRLSGFLGLGEKQSGAWYSREDIGLLRTLANQGAVAVQNARSYHALQQANEELRATQSRLIEAERLAAIGELSAAVAHGIRNPLAGIKAAAQLARMDLPDDHPMQESVHDILSETGKLEARIKTLLDFAKPFEPHPSPTEIKALVESAVTSLRSQLSDHRVEAVVDIEPPSLSAEIDAAQIEEVLLALMSNAIDAIGNDGKITVHVRPIDSGNRLRLVVCDSGPGIAPEQIDRVFRLFFTTKSSGTGFGLAVAKKVVERHGGTIGATSQPGKGAYFTIELPTHAVQP